MSKGKRDPSTHRTPEQTRRHRATYQQRDSYKAEQRARAKNWRRDQKNGGSVGDGKDVNHKKPMAKGGSKTASSNLERIPESKNRGHGMSPGGTKKGTSVRRRVGR